MKRSRLQHALIDAQEHLQRTSSARSQDGSGTDLLEVAHASKTRLRDERVLPQTTPLAVAPLRLNAEELAFARSTVQLVIDTLPSVPRIDSLAQDRLLRAVVSELPFAIENPAKRHEADVRRWYAIDKVVGNGTFGRVSSARHRLSDTQVAIKSYYRERGATVCCRAPPVSARSASSAKNVATNSDDALDWKRVRQEVKVMAALWPHASVVRFVEAFETPTQMHVVMEFAAGETLCDFLQQHGTPTARGSEVRRLSEPSTRTIFAQLCAAVASLHDQNVIHRDLKLENVLVDKHGRATLIDFGFSQFDDRSDRGSSAKNFCGTPSYMAPEVVACKSYDGKRGDVWSLGVVLYVLLCGRFPFLGQTFHQLYHNIRATQCAFPTAVSKEAQVLIRSIFMVDPTKRPSVRGILAHPWMVAHGEVPQRQLTARVDCSHFPAAFMCWDEATARICEALELIYGLDASALALAVRDKRRNGATALVRLVLLVVEKESAALLGASDPQHPRVPTRSSVRSSEGNDQGGQRVSSLTADISEEGIAVECEVPSASAHKEHLDALIRLVKTSLSLQH